MFWENPSGSVYLDLNAKRHYFKDRTEFVRWLRKLIKKRPMRGTDYYKVEFPDGDIVEAHADSLEIMVQETLKMNGLTNEDIRNTRRRKF